MAKSKKEKKDFFEELHKLDSPDESTADVDGVLASLRASKPARVLFRSSQASNSRRTSHLHRQIQRLGRTVSAPSTLASSSKASPIIEPSDPQPRTREPTRTIKGEMPLTKGKRKRGQSLEVLPESQQIFKELKFYFIPNNDVAPARKLRIRKALERGAAWIKQWENGITHIIVDRHLNYGEILKFLKISSIPPSIIVVNELYPAECIQFRTLVNPEQRLYQVPGRQPEPTTEQKQSSAASSEKSLPLKPEKRAMDQPSETPTHTEPSEQGSADQPPVTEAIARSPPRAPAVQSFKPRGQPPDALDQAISETLAVKDLPLDDDDEENPSPSSSMRAERSAGNSSDEEPEKPKAKKSSSDKSWQAKFSCMDKHTGTDSQENANARTIEILQQMADYYDRTQDHWRTTAYRKAISALKKQPHKITSQEEALAIPSIGSRLAAKIEEIVFADRLRRLENTTFDASDTALQLFLKIYGVGHAQASQWINQGHRTLEDLTTKASLTKNQKIGIDRIDDFAARVPRKEVERHGKIVRDAIAKEDARIEVTIGGSYRRGAQDSGDVDFIITKPDCSIDTVRTIILDTVIPRLFASNYLKCTLAATSRTDGSKWHGAACLPGSKVWRRIDFLLVPHEELGAALIYFTGNDIFNRNIRLLARKKGYRLNQRGLWRDVFRGKGGGRDTKGTLVEGRSERRVFELLGVPWRPPSHRIC
ncbi:MAG: hypothetical protein Q9181_001796 [Wetmoreana brouardii]